jgi:hypothetical protein
MTDAISSFSAIVAKQRGCEKESITASRTILRTFQSRHEWQAEATIGRDPCLIMLFRSVNRLALFQVDRLLTEMSIS